MEKNESNKEFQELMEKENMYRQIIEYSVETIVIHAHHQILYINQSGANFLRATKEDIIGAQVLDVFQENDRPAIKERIQKAMGENVPGELIEHVISRLDGSLVDVELYCHPVIYGDKKAIQSVFRDITKRKEAERNHKRLLREINEVSASIVPVLDGISILPLIGSIDTDRANQLMEDIPLKIQQQAVECLIIDFSGIYNFDEVVTDYLLKINAVMQMLGVRSIITGIRPELAHAATELGLNLFSMKTMATVQQALHYLGVKK